MVIDVSPKFLCWLFDEFVGNSDTMFNFETDGETLWVQYLGDYTATMECPVTCVDGDKNAARASFWVSKYIHVMSREEGVRITMTDAAILLQQSAFYSTLLCEYEEKRNLPNIGDVVFKAAYSGRIKFLAHVATVCNAMAKELSIPNPDIVISGGKFYLNYQQAAYVDTLDYPESCIPENVFRSFAYKLDERTTYAYLEESSTYVFITGKHRLWVTSIGYMIKSNTVGVLDKKLAECVDVTEVTFSPYKEKLDIVAGAFSKKQLQLTVGEKVYCVMTGTNKSHVRVGYNFDVPLLSMNITSAQLSCITRLFGEDESVKIRKGAGCICLNSGTKNLLIAGRIY